MKKLLSILLSFILTIGLCGCDLPFNNKPKKAGYLLQADIISISLKSMGEYYGAMSYAISPETEIPKAIIHDTNKIDDSRNYVNKLKETTDDQSYIEMTDDLSQVLEKFKSFFNNVSSLGAAALTDFANSDSDFFDPDDSASSTLKKDIDNTLDQGKKYYDNFLDKYEVEKNTLGDMSHCDIPDNLYKDYVTQLKFIFENAVNSRKYMAVQFADLQKEYVDNQLSFIDPALENAHIFQQSLPSDADENVKNAVQLFIDGLSLLSEDYNYISNKLGDNPDPSGNVVMPKSEYSNELENYFNDFNNVYNDIL